MYDSRRSLCWINMIITAYIGSSNIAKDLIAEAVNMIAFVKRDPEIGAK